MKAAVLRNWKKISVENTASPVPAAGEVLIDVTYAGICGSDVHIYNGDNPIARVPVVPGHEFTGKVTKLGEGVHGISEGTRVAVQPLISCGTCTPCSRDAPHVCENLIVVGVNQNGGFAEKVVVPQNCVFPIPDTLLNETAVLAEPFSIAMHSLKRGRISPSDRVLIIGAGPIGLYCALTARYLGARQVQISEPNPSRRASAANFGFASVDPMDHTILEVLRSVSDLQGFDIVVETSGTSGGFEIATQAAAVQGRIVLLGFPSGGRTDLHVTRCVIKELSLIGSRVCSREEFQQTLDMLSQLQSGAGIALNDLVTPARTLEMLDRSILDVEDGIESVKILVDPVR